MVTGKPRLNYSQFDLFNVNFSFLLLDVKRFNLDEVIKSEKNSRSKPEVEKILVGCEQSLRDYAEISHPTQRKKCRYHGKSEIV